MPEIFDRLDLNHQQIQEDIVMAYLREGSVNAFLPQFPEVPEQTAHNWLDYYDVVKLPGRKPNSLSSVLYFLTNWINAGDVPLERWYRQYTPSRVKEALSTPSLHRVVDHIRRLTTRLSATALVITPEGDPHHVLVGNDITTPNSSVGKSFGAISLPMTYSQAGEHPYLSVKRVLQQEAFSDTVIRKEFPDWLIAENPRAFMHVAVADVNVAAYHLEVPWNMFEHFSSPKLDGLDFMPLGDLLNKDALDAEIRSGMVEIAAGHSSHIDSSQSEPITWSLSRLNEKIALART